MKKTIKEQLLELENKNDDKSLFLFERLTKQKKYNKIFLNKKTGEKND